MATWIYAVLFFAAALEGFKQGRIRGLGAHRVQEIGKDATVYYASVLEMELLSSCQQFSPRLAFEVLLTIAHTAKFVLVRDVGRKNVGSRRVDDCRMGEPPHNKLSCSTGISGRSTRGRAGLIGLIARRPKACGVPLTPSRRLWCRKSRRSSKGSSQTLNLYRSFMMATLNPKPKALNP